jgi:hypothetical protein
MWEVMAKIINTLHDKFKTNQSNTNNCFIYVMYVGERGSVVVKALLYKLEARGFDTRWDSFFNLPNPSRRTRPWGLLSL